MGTYFLRFLVFWGAMSLTLSLGSCSGGGGEEGRPSTEGPNVGSGWIGITNPSPYGVFDTELHSVDLNGTSFVSPGATCPAGIGDLGSGYQVTWYNAANSTSGEARAGLNCLVIVFAWWEVDFGVIPLEIGQNRITVTATDSAGNVGRDSITITRHPDTTPPTVTSTAPTNGATSVTINNSLTVTFSEQMDAATINAGTFLLTDDRNNPVAGTVYYSTSSNTATLDPSGLLGYSTTYTATITTGVKDKAGGNAMQANYSWSFTTGLNPDTTAPRVSATSPVNGSHCVAIDGTISATFNEEINPSTITPTSFTVRAAGNLLLPGALSYINQTTIFRPDSVLALASPYTATITTAVKDLAGNPLSDDYSWSFTTVAGSGLGIWNPTSLTDVPFARTAHTAVWTGNEMIVSGGLAWDSFWGRFDYTQQGGKYNPSTGIWMPISTDGAPGIAFQTAVWTGHETLNWGGYASGVPSGRGQRYDPLLDRWQPISNVGAPSSRHDHTAVWTGQEMLVWGGRGTSISFNTGARYDPTTDTWHPISTTGAPSARYGHSAVWTGSEMIIWGGVAGSYIANDGARYDPSTDTWRPISTTGAPSGRNGHTAVWTGNEMIIWGAEFGATNSGGRYSPSTDTWRPTDTTCAPSGRGHHSAVWTGSRMVIWGGATVVSYFNNGATYNPTNNTWDPLNITNTPSARAYHTAIWTGTEMIVWGGTNGSPLNSGGRHIP